MHSVRPSGHTRLYVFCAHIKKQNDNARLMELSHMCKQGGVSYANTDQSVGFQPALTKEISVFASFSVWTIHDTRIWEALAERITL